MAKKIEGQSCGICAKRETRFGTCIDPTVTFAKPSEKSRPPNAEPIRKGENGCFVPASNPGR